MQELERGKQVQKLTRGRERLGHTSATNNCNRYMGQPICERLQCLDIENCTPVSSVSGESFADATVEDIKFKGIEQVGGPVGSIYLATVRVLEWQWSCSAGGGQRSGVPRGSGAGPGCVWNVASEKDQNRLRPTRLRPSLRRRAAGVGRGVWGSGATFFVL